MLYYLLQTLVFQLVFLLIYDLFLKKETFFVLNRVYLWSTPILSLLVPLIRIESLGKVVPQEYIVILPELVLGGQKEVLPAVQEAAGSGISLVTAIWLAGAAFSMLLFIRKIANIYKLKNIGIIRSCQHYKEVVVNKDDIAFSFFNWVFLSENVKQKDHEHIIRHELVHVKEMHSVDLFFFELLRMVFWFNPLVYVFQNRMSELHEFTADSKAVHQDHLDYCNKLLQATFKTEKISFTNQFFNHSLIKKRIVMLQKSKSGKIWQLKYLVLVPVLAAMLIYTSCETEKGTENQLTSSNNSVKAEVYSKIEKEFKAADEPFEVINSYIPLLNRLKGEIPTEEEYYTREAVLQLFMASKTVETNLESIQIHSSPTYEEFLEWAKSVEGKKALELQKQQMYDFDKDGKVKIKAQEEYPFAIIPNKPSFKEPCEEGMSEFDCFKMNLDKHVIKNFTYPKEAQEANEQGRVYVVFRINTDGKVEVSKVSGKYESLKNEAIRIMELLPQMNPGADENGKPVPVIFSYPLVFKLG